MPKAKITRILSVNKHIDKNGKVYYKTQAIVDHDEVFGFSRDKNEFSVGDEVVSYFHNQYNQAKMQLAKKKGE